MVKFVYNVFKNTLSNTKLVTWEASRFILITNFKTIYYEKTRFKKWNDS
jgi:hypothetical protein